MNAFVLLNTKKNILKNVKTEQFWGTIDFHSIYFSMSSQWCINTAWLQTFFRISSFVFSRTKTFIQVWNYLRVSKWWYNFYFWVNYPFNSLFKIIQNTYTEDHSPFDPWLTTQSKFSAHVLSSAVDSCNVLRIGVAKITISNCSAIGQSANPTPNTT